MKAATKIMKWIYGLSCVLLVIGICLCITKPADKYNEAILYIEDEKYDAAIEILDGLQKLHYKDSAKYLNAAENGKIEKEANEAEKYGNYDKAIELLESLDIYESSVDDLFAKKNKIKNVKYHKAISLYDDEKYEEALIIFANLYYEDSDDYYKDCIFKIRNSMVTSEYFRAENLYDAGKYDEALTIFEKLDGHARSNEYIEAIKGKK